jgi:hypothetical protein
VNGRVLFQPVLVDFKIKFTDCDRDSCDRGLDRHSDTFLSFCKPNNPAKQQATKKMPKKRKAAKKEEDDTATIEDARDPQKWNADFRQENIGKP